MHVSKCVFGFIYYNYISVLLSVTVFVCHDKGNVFFNNKLTSICILETSNYGHFNYVPTERYKNQNVLNYLNGCGPIEKIPPKILVANFLFVVTSTIFTIPSEMELALVPVFLIDYLPGNIHIRRCVKRCGCVLHGSFTTDTHPLKSVILCHIRSHNILSNI